MKALTRYQIEAIETEIDKKIAEKVDALSKQFKVPNAPTPAELAELAMKHHQREIQRMIEKILNRESYRSLDRDSIGMLGRVADRLSIRDDAEKARSEACKKLRAELVEKRDALVRRLVIERAIAPEIMAEIAKF